MGYCFVLWVVIRDKGYVRMFSDRSGVGIGSAKGELNNKRFFLNETLWIGRARYLWRPTLRRNHWLPLAINLFEINIQTLTF
uniref:Uncharacterized protein n=1 Tax=Pararge aegeria TaxID=116150 RepID=S4P5C8_9NEOP